MTKIKQRRGEKYCLNIPWGPEIEEDLKTKEKKAEIKGE